MRLRHRGPDTGGHMIMTESVDPRPGQWLERDGHDGWWLQIFSIPHGTSATPRALDPAALIGENRQLSAVRLDADWQCGTLVPRCPDDWFAWRFYGRVEVRLAGLYEFCTESDDGSLLHVDKTPSPQGREAESINYELVVDNDGMHGPQTRCGSLHLSPGRYHFRVRASAARAEARAAARAAGGWRGADVRRRVGSWPYLCVRRRVGLRRRACLHQRAALCASAFVGRQLPPRPPGSPCRRLSGDSCPGRCDGALR